jgi:putative Holliday junction resolvase
MPVHPWPHLLNRLKKGHVLLGLDVGTVTIGLAISDPGMRQATPLDVIMRTKVTDDIKALAAIARERQVGGFVIGLPLHLDGGMSDSAKKAKLLAKQIQDEAALFEKPPEISFFDERLTTAAAERFLISEADLSRKKRDAVIDKLAAQMILQAALDQYQNQKPS